MYFSADPDSGGGLCLAVATADSPAGPFTDVGAPLECGETFTDIDPMAFQDPADGRWWLFWGSGFEPIQVRELAPDGLAFADGSVATPVLEPDPYLEYENLVEGAWVVARDGWYYLFYAGRFLLRRAELRRPRRAQPERDRAVREAGRGA